jgi:putative Ca2+/H+ antiporter (TMEM165/GDT1 family)
MLPLFIAAFGTVFAAEIVGDKLLYTTGVLATRYRTLPIMLGMAVAFAAKMGVAVLLGEAIATLSPLLVATVTTASFLAVAYALWRKPVTRGEAAADHGSPKAAMVSFATIFFSEWGDLGQITAATMAARFASPAIVWLAAVAAMMTKGALAASIGAGVRRWIQDHLSPAAIRYSGVGVLVLLAVLSVVETVVEGHA